MAMFIGKVYRSQVTGGLKPCGLADDWVGQVPWVYAAFCVLAS